MPIDRADLDNLRAAAANNAGPLAEALLGQRNAKASTKTRWHFGSNQGSLWVSLEGARKGTWHDAASGEGGDLIALVEHARGCSFLEAVDWLRSWFGVPPGERAPPRPAPERDPGQDKQHQRNLRDLARKAWQASGPATGTLVETYLACRGLALPPDAPLRFHPSCPREHERLPAMVALLTDASTGEAVGIHRTYLRADGAGKAEGKSKMMLGGAGVVRLVPDEEVTLGLGIAEGIETSLAVMQAGWRPVWSCGSAGGVSRFPVLGGIEHLTVFADPGKAGEKAGATCAGRWSEAGREARVFAAPPDTSDWLDLLMREGAL